MKTTKQSKTWDQYCTVSCKFILKKQKTNCPKLVWHVESMPFPTSTDMHTSWLILCHILVSTHCHLLRFVPVVCKYQTFFLVVCSELIPQEWTLGLLLVGRDFPVMVVVVMPPSFISIHKPPGDATKQDIATGEFYLQTTFRNDSKKTMQKCIKPISCFTQCFDFERFFFLWFFFNHWTFCCQLVPLSQVWYQLRCIYGRFLFLYFIC